MSYTVETSLFCDGCSEHITVTDDDRQQKIALGKARRVARQEGWSFDRNVKKDFCPKCKAAAEKQET